MQDPNERFKNFVLIVFNQTLGILKHHNTDRERNGAFCEFFGSANLGRDLNRISQGKPIDSGIYIAAINAFFNSDNPECIKKTAILIEKLESEGYITGLNGADIRTKCDQNTLHIYKKILLNIWNFYYSQYPSDGGKQIESYSMPQSDIDSIIKKFTEYHLPVSLEFYQQRIPDIIELLRTKNPDSLFTSIETEYVYFFKNVLENKSFYTLSREDRTVFFHTLYAISDILDQAHHKDSYRINLEVLTFLNEIYNDNYTNICVDDIRRIQGCIYAISIEATEESLQGNIKLTPGHNLTRINSNYKPISQKAKLDMCDKALRNLLANKYLKKLDKHFEEADYISLYENRLQRNRAIHSDEIDELYVLSLVYSNIAACTLQYIKQRINIDSKYNEYAEICELYHNRSRYIRGLIVRITRKMYGETSSDYKKALHFLASYYHSVATRYFYMKKYADSIAIRSVLYSFYTTLDLKEKARTQLELAPIGLYEQNGGSNQLYSLTTKSLFENCRKDFSYLFSKELMPYDSFSKLVNEYQKYKNLF